MLVVSSREDFYDPFDLSEDELFADIDYPEFLTGTDTTRDAFLRQVSGKRILILIHGYRNQGDAIAKSYGKVEAELRRRGLLGSGPGQYERVVGYLWPGGWARVGFPISVLRANKSGRRLRGLLEQLAVVGATVDLQTHSLGARVALEALDRQTVRIANLHLAAPAVDNECIQQREEYQEACESCDRVYVFHSLQDSVLRVTYRIGDFPEFDEALGAKGPDEPDKLLDNTFVVDCRDVVFDHGGYRDSAEYFDYWKEQLAQPGGGSKRVRLARQAAVGA